MNAEEYRHKEAITDANFWDGNEIDFDAIYDFAESYANHKKEKFKYCPYCGDKLSHKVSTDSNSKLVCKGICRLTTQK